MDGISLLILVLVQVVVGVVAYPIAKPGYPDECGGVKIPYPFGIGYGCFYSYNHTSSYFDYIAGSYKDSYYGNHYNITCNTTTDPPTPATYHSNPVVNINLEDHSIRLSRHVVYNCYQNNQPTLADHAYLLLVYQFRVSGPRNKFVAIGCNNIATILGFESNKSFVGGCMAYCTSIEDIRNNTCSGVGCCNVPVPVPVGTTELTVRLDNYKNLSDTNFNPCSAAFVVEDGAFSFSTANLTSPESYFEGLRLPVVFDWSIPYASCASTGPDKLNCGRLNTQCIDGENSTQGYRCKCKSGYTGNPYLPDGCDQDVDECVDPNLNGCEKAEYCVNKEGGYECICPKGLHGEATKAHPCKPKTSQGWDSWPTPLKLTLCGGIGLIFIIIGGIFLQHYHSKKKILDLKRSFFHKNGGLILHRELRGRNISIQKFKIFTSEELEDATACFSDSNVVGRGGFGMVYRGTLPNGQYVAIKRSLKLDPSQADQFINETLVLSEINNRNVVKLLGCCLDTEVPLLVYEFVNNGTLYDHLHDERKASLLSWEIRLQVAEAVASVLSYPHTTISIPIIHRDMKSMNILLDENYTAKVADFGASKLVPMDEDQLATVVLGTCGYLDPEYMQTHELTQKSDVYSFGVVLVELLTRKKAISYNMPEAERSLAMHFLCKMKDNCLFDIVDHGIMTTDNLDQVKKVAELARWCLRLRGDERPTMKEVAMELESIRKMAKNSCYKTATLLEDCEPLFDNNPIKDDDHSGITTGSTTSYTSSGNRLLNLEFDDGR